MSVYDVIRQPVVTEKSTALAALNKYVFEVSDYASKAIIKEAIETAFGVHVTEVNVMTVKGKMKRFGRRPKAQRTWRKAIETLQEGDKIELFASA